MTYSKDDIYEGFTFKSPNALFAFKLTEIKNGRCRISTLEADSRSSLNYPVSVAVQGLNQGNFIEVNKKEADYAIF